MPDILTIAKELGTGFAFGLIMLYFMKQQDERHRKEIQKEADERECLRISYETRAEHHHNRGNEMMIEVLTVIRENSKAIATLVEAMRRA